VALEGATAAAVAVAALCPSARLRREAMAGGGQQAGCLYRGEVDGSYSGGSRSHLPRSHSAASGGRGGGEGARWWVSVALRPKLSWCRCECRPRRLNRSRGMRASARHPAAHLPCAGADEDRRSRTPTSPDPTGRKPVPAHLPGEGSTALGLDRRGMVCGQRSEPG
jgi:hypothetical protein